MRTPVASVSWPRSVPSPPTILNDFGFPKLYDGGTPHLDSRFTPMVRGMPYHEIGSKGAKTLTAVAWALSMYELARERGAPTSGF